jgi:predicted lactoylglutathione lyase
MSAILGRVAGRDPDFSCVTSAVRCSSYDWSFYDLNGHGWGVFWMDPSALQG